MSIFFSNHSCYPNAIVMHKLSGIVYRVRGNISLWNMTAVLVPYDVPYNKDIKDIMTVSSGKMKLDYVILDEGNDN